MAARAIKDSRISELPPVAVISLRDRRRSDLPDAWRALTAVALDRGLSWPGSRAIAVVYDDPAQTPAERIRCDACLSIDHHRLAEVPIGDVAGERGVRAETIMGCTALRFVHEGAPGRIGGVYRDVAQRLGALANNATRVAHRGPYYEVHRRNPALRTEEETVVDIYFPIDDDGMARRSTLAGEVVA